jgi:hypothetical protein
LLPEIRENFYFSAEIGPGSSIITSGINRLRKSARSAGRENISSATASGRELAGESPRPSPKLGREPATPPWLPKKCGSQGDKCRQPDAEVENEPDHGRFITCDYDNFKDSEICGRERCYGPLLPIPDLQRPTTNRTRRMVFCRSASEPGRTRKSDIHSMGGLGAKHGHSAVSIHFPVERAWRLRGRRSACSHDRKIIGLENPGSVCHGEAEIIGGVP